MQHNKTTLFTIAAATLLGSTQLASANTLSDNKTVRSAGDQIIRSAAFGTCVRTKWEKGTNICAPAPKAEPVVLKEPKQKTIIGQADRSVYFEFNKASLTTQAQAKLDTLANTLNQADDVERAKIVGFADRIGSSDYNKQLSKERAMSVKNYLASRGYINTEVAEVRALGESQPITNCGDHLNRERAIECLGADRRVEVEVKYTDTQLTYAQ